MLLKCYTLYVNKFGKLSSGHRTGTCHFSFLSQRRAIPMFELPYNCAHFTCYQSEWKWKSLSPVQLFETAWALVHGILQTRILEWVAFPFSRGVFPTQGSNSGLPLYRHILYLLIHKGILKILQVSLQQYMNQELPDVEAEFRKAEEQRSNCQHSLDHRESKKIPEKVLLHWLH